MDKDTATIGFCEIGKLPTWADYVKYLEAQLAQAQTEIKARKDDNISAIDTIKGLSQELEQYKKALELAVLDAVKAYHIVLKPEQIAFLTEKFLAQAKEALTDGPNRE